MVIQDRRIDSQMQRIWMELLPGNHVIALADAVRISPAILMSQFQNIVTEAGIAVCDHFLQKIQGMLPFFSFGLLQMALP